MPLLKDVSAFLTLHRAFAAAELVDRFAAKPLLKILDKIKDALVVESAREAVLCLLLFSHAWAAQEKAQRDIAESIEKTHLEGDVVDQVLTRINAGLTQSCVCSILFGCWLTLVASALVSKYKIKNRLLKDNRIETVTWLMRCLNPLQEMAKKDKRVDVLMRRFKAMASFVNTFDPEPATCRFLRNATFARCGKGFVRLPKDREALITVSCTRPPGLASRAKCAFEERPRCAAFGDQVLCPEDVLVMFNVEVGAKLPENVADMFAIESVEQLESLTL